MLGWFSADAARASRRNLFERLLIVGNIFGQEFQRNKAAKLGVLGLVDNTHPAAAELLNNAVVRDGLAYHWRESYVCETGKSMKVGEMVVAQEDCCCLGRERSV